ncbi:MAG TPA: hypothetical protein VLL48_11740, partial [Longimicrobiales bacterium]|nr:hypothetical protein [Longimicrobiales bacterium]
MCLLGAAGACDREGSGGMESGVTGIIFAGAWRRPLFRASCAVVGLLGCEPAARGGGEDGSGASTLVSYRQAREVVERALEVMGSAENVREAGGIRIRATGVLNKGAELQGLHPDSASPGEFREAVTADLAGGRVAWEHREHRYDGTLEWLREVYRPGDEHLILVLQADPPFPVLLRSPENRTARRKLLRRIPLLLLEEVLDSPASLRWHGRRNGLDQVTGGLESGETVTLLFRPGDGTLARVEYLTDVQGHGDTAVRWTFEDY